MDPTSWSAYSQHFSRLGVTHPPLPQQTQMNELALSRQEHNMPPGYGSGGGHFLIGPQGNDPPFNANLFATNYDVFSNAFPGANKGHLGSFPQGVFKAVSRENDFNDLRTGFSHCYGRNSEGNNGLPSGHLFPNSMPPGSWRHSGMIPNSCGPFGVLPHETVLQRSHLVGRAGEKLAMQTPKQSRSSLPGGPFIEQDLGRGYRGILSSPARPPSSYVDSSNTSHSSLLSPQSDPYFSSVSDNYYSSCSKNDFAAYSSYCSNVQPGVQRSSISPYCYPQSFGNFESNEKQDVPTTSTNTSANANFTNFVPNSSLNGNHSSHHHHNDQISRQSVITSNINNNSAMFNSESHPPNHSYNIREGYPYPPGAAHANSCIPTHPTNNNRSETNGSRQAMAHMSNSHHPSTGQNLYPPINTPIPASTPAHATPPSSSMGQAYVPTPLPMSHDSGCSSVNSQSVMYHSPSNDGCYSTPGTCPSESGSPAKHEHSSPSVYSIDSSNLSMNSVPYAEQHHVRSHSGSDVNYGVANGGPASSSDIHNNASGSSPKLAEEGRREVSPALVASDCRSQLQPKDAHLPQVLPIDMVKLNKESAYQNPIDARFDGRPASIPMPHAKHLDLPAPPRLECAKSEAFPFSSESPPPALDFTAKDKIKCKPSRKRKCEGSVSPLPLNCTYSHLQNTESQLNSPESAADPEEIKTPLSDASVRSHASPMVGGVSDLQAAGNSSPLPVDLSHTVKVSVSKPDSPPAKKESKEALPELNYDTDKSSGGKWSLTKQDAAEIDSKVDISADIPENLSTQNSLEKEVVKGCSPLCRTPPMDDLSDESKKLCNSIEEDLGFLAGLSSDPDVEDSVSKGSFSDKKGKKEKGFLQSFLTFLESSNEPTVGGTAAGLEVKEEKKDSEDSSAKQGAKVKEDVLSPIEDPKSDGDKTIIEEAEDKDTFDEAPPLDPALFGCSTLQKEMVVPNPEAPSFSSDEDENSTQGIFDSVAMAIQRLCEDNEEDHSEKGNRLSTSGKSGGPKKEMPVLTSMAEAPAKDEEMPESGSISLDDNPLGECTIRRSCIMRGRRGRRRKTRHLLVIKVKRAADKHPAVPDSLKTAPAKPRKTRNTKKSAEVAKALPNSQRRTLMRKCKEKGVRKKNSRGNKRKSRNCSKKKYEVEEKEDTVDIIIDEDDDEPSGPPPLSALTPPIPLDATPPPPMALPQLESQPTFPQPLASTTIPVPPLQPATALKLFPGGPAKVARPAPPKKKKVTAAIGYRTRKRRRKPRKPVVLPETEAVPAVAAGPEPPRLCEESTAATLPMPGDGEVQPRQPAGVVEGGWNTETHFKTGDFVKSVDSKDSESPPMWRIEGKNVLQLFEVLENEEGSCSILYRNTSSYSRWSPSSKHKYLKQSVKVIKSDDDTVIVEIIKNSETIADKNMSGSCDYTVHPQRENFEVYLQTLVSHSLDPEFIIEIFKEKDEYFLSHLQVIEEITSQKKELLHPNNRWGPPLSSALKKYPHVDVTKRTTEEEESFCQLCLKHRIQFDVRFQGPVYDPMTLVSRDDGKTPECDSTFPLCGSCTRTVTLYSRLHHHKYNFFQMGCKKIRDVNKSGDKNSHRILEECLQDAEWMTQMFQEMLEMWSACDKYR